MMKIEQVSARTGVSVECSYHDAQVMGPILSDEARVVVEIIFFVALNGPISCLGSAVNVVNIIIFCKQGFNDSVNISLCALAFSDLTSLLPLVWISICYNPLFRHSDIGFDPVEVHYLTAGLPHSCFVRVTGLVTAFLTFERCVCIALPLKVKNIITPRRTLISIVAIFVIIIATSVPMFTSIYLAPSFQATTNKTIIGLAYTSNSVIFGNFSFTCNVFAQLSSFTIMIVCTVILVLKLQAKSKWRHKALSVTDVSDSMSTRDKRVMKMVAFISVIFIICYLPSAGNLTLRLYLSPEYSPTGVYMNSYFVTWAIIITLEEINSSVSILIYYKMSSKFRVTFKEICFTYKRLVKS